MQTIPGVTPVVSQAPAQQSAPVAAPGRGLFGRAFQGLTRENLQAAAAAVQDYENGGGNAFAELMARRADEQMRQTMLSAQQGRWNRQDRREDAQDQVAAAERQRQEQHRQQVMEIIAALPEGERQMAMLDPEAYVAGMMRHRFPAPQRGGGSSSAAPALPNGFVWED